MIIDRLPPFAKRFFLPFQSSLSGRQFAHLWSLVLAVAVNLRAAKLIHLSAVTPDHGHRTRRGAFLSHGDWSAPALVEQSALGLLEAMKPKAGEVVQLILDDTRIPKRGSKMGYVSKIYDHKQRKFVHGHIVLFAAIVFRGVVLPFQIDLWKPKGHCGPRYRKLTDMAAQIIRAFGAPEGVKVQVLFDAFYLCPTVTKACEAQGFAFFSVAQRNRNLRTANGRTRRIGALMAGLIRHKGKNVRMKRSRKTARLRIACCDGHLSRIGRVRMVVSKRPRGPWKKTIAIVTNQINLKARQIVAIYECRWLIEVLFKELRQDLGLADYQMLHKDGIVHHLHVCCLAHLLLTHQCLEALGEKARKANRQVKLPPMNHRLAELRSRIARDQVRRIVKGAQHAKIREQLYERLVA